MTTEVEVLAPAGIYATDLSHSSILWRVDHLGLTDYTARFAAFSATLEIDPAAPENAVLRATVDPASIQTAYPYTERKDFDAELETDARFFNVSAFPEITFVSTGVTPTGPLTALVEGELTMLGTTQPFSLDVTYNGSLEAHPFTKRPMLGFTGIGTLKRSDFGMEYLIGQIGDEVEVIIQAEFSRIPEQD